MSKVKRFFDDCDAFFFGSGMVIVVTLASWAFLHFFRTGFTVVFLIPLVIGVVAIVVGYLRGIFSAENWLEAIFRAFLLTPILLVEAGALIYFYVNVLEYIPGAFYWNLLKDSLT